MQYVILAGCILASFSGVLCQGAWNPWNQNNLWNQNQNSMAQGTWNHQHQQQGGNMQNMLAQLLGQGMQGGTGGTGGMGNMGQMGNMGNMGQGNGMLSTLIQLMMLKPLLEGLGTGHKEEKDNDEDEMGKMYEGFMKGKMSQEFLDHILAYTELKKAEEEFGGAMKGLCGMVNGTYLWAKQHKVEIFNATDAAFMEDLERKTEHMTEEEKFALLTDWLDWAHASGDMTAHEVFFRMATWSCMTGHTFMEATMHMERIQRGTDKCDDGKDRK